MQSFPDISPANAGFFQSKSNNHSILTFGPAFMSPLHYNLLVRNLAKVIIGGLSNKDGDGLRKRHLKSEFVLP